MTKLEKLINEYNSKIAVCDATIQTLGAEMNATRYTDDTRYTDASNLRYSEQKMRQAYFQIVKDLEDLQDAN